jgi:hypothetical protein
MRILVTGLLAVSALLSGCQKSADAEFGSQKSQGRFSGVGIFDAGKLWAQMAISASPKDPAQANISDDDYVIAVIDSQTGEVRQCGNHSGFCVSMNPWASTSPTRLPVKLMKHASDLARDEQAAMDASKTSK